MADDPAAQLCMLPATTLALRGDLLRLLTLSSFTEKKHPSEPAHWYLPATGSVCLVVSGAGHLARFAQVQWHTEARERFWADVLATFG